MLCKHPIELLICRGGPRSGRCADAEATSAIWRECVAVHAVERVEVLEGLILHASGVGERLRCDRPSRATVFRSVEERPAVEKPTTRYGSTPKSACENPEGASLDARHCTHFRAFEETRANRCFRSRTNDLRRVAQSQLLDVA